MLTLENTSSLLHCFRTKGFRKRTGCSSSCKNVKPFVFTRKDKYLTALNIPVEQKLVSMTMSLKTVDIYWVTRHIRKSPTLISISQNHILHKKQLRGSSAATVSICATVIFMNNSLPKSVLASRLFFPTNSMSTPLVWTSWIPLHRSTRQRHFLCMLWKEFWNSTKLMYSCLCHVLHCSMSLRCVNNWSGPRILCLSELLLVSSEAADRLLPRFAVELPQLGACLVWIVEWYHACCWGDLVHHSLRSW